MKIMTGSIRGALMTILLMSGAPVLPGQDSAAIAPAKKESERAGAQYGHADSSVAAVLKSTHTTEHFVFYFAEDSAALKDIFAVLEDNYTRVTKAFKMKPANSFKVEIYPDILSYHRRTFGKGSPDWMIGNFDPDERTIRIVSPNQPGSVHTYQSVVQAAVHEFVHGLTLEYRNWDRENLPVWLNEGVSLYYEGPFEEGGIKQVKKAVSSNKVPAISRLEEDFLKYGGYVFSYTIVEFIVNKYGSEKLMELVKEPDSYKKTFLMSKKEFNKAWQEYLKVEYK